MNALSAEILLSGPTWLAFESIPNRSLIPTSVTFFSGRRYTLCTAVFVLGDVNTYVQRELCLSSDPAIVNALDSPIPDADLACSSQYKAEILDAMAL